MPSFRTFAALCLGKLAYALTAKKTLGGTALPGKLAGYLDPHIIQHLLSQIQHGSIVVSGTNGKTTTSHLLATLLKKAGFRLYHNTRGSNMLRGVASTLINQTPLLSAPLFHYGVWEIDEAVLPQACRIIQPRFLILLNLFRDQLDRYGEVAALGQLWQKTVRSLPSKTTLILNADDPQLAALASLLPPKRSYTFGLALQNALPSPEPTADTLLCPRCHTLLKFKKVFFSHLGDYSCPRCHFRRPPLDFSLTQLKTSSNFLKATIATPAGSLQLTLPPLGLYNLYNFLAVTAFAHHLHLTSLLSSLSKNFSPAFGRGEVIKTGGKQLHLYLVKNPTGCTQVLKLVRQSPKTPLLFAINDHSPDGHDVSWLFDIDFQPLANNLSRPFILTGTRAANAALALKYHGFKNLTLQPSPNKALSLLLRQKNRRLFILANYTAMLHLRNLILFQGKSKFSQLNKAL